MYYEKIDLWIKAKLSHNTKHTGHIYIYIYIYMRLSHLLKPFFSNKWSISFALWMGCSLIVLSTHILTNGYSLTLALYMYIYIYTSLNIFFALFPYVEFCFSPIKYPCFSIYQVIAMSIWWHIIFAKYKRWRLYFYMKQKLKEPADLRKRPLINGSLCDCDNKG